MCWCEGNLEVFREVAVGERADKEVMDDLPLQTVLGGHLTDTSKVVLTWGREGREGEGRGGGEGGDATQRPLRQPQATACMNSCLFTDLAPL